MEGSNKSARVGGGVQKAREWRREEERKDREIIRRVLINRNRTV